MEDRLEKIEISIGELSKKIIELDKKIDLLTQDYKLKFYFYNILIPIFIFVIGLLIGKNILG
ncbi:MAG: hypothetical protein QXG85_04385 [Thermoproteota archaeon]